MTVLNLSECNACGERTVTMTAERSSNLFCVECGADEMMQIAHVAVEGVSYDEVVGGDLSG